MPDNQHRIKSDGFARTHQVLPYPSRIPSTSSIFLISFCPLSISFSFRYLALIKAVPDLTTIEVDRATPAKAVVPLGSSATDPTEAAARRDPPTAAVTKETSRVMPARLSQMSKNCGKRALVSGSPISSTSKRAKTWQLCSSYMYLFRKDFCHTSSAVSPRYVRDDGEGRLILFGQDISTHPLFQLSPADMQCTYCLQMSFCKPGSRRLPLSGSTPALA